MEGWILDLYPSGGEMVAWIKVSDGKVHSLVDDWAHRIYAAADDKDGLEILARSTEVQSLANEVKLTRRIESATDYEDRDVLELRLKRSSDSKRLGRIIERMGHFGSFRLYNVDVPPEQAYLYEKGLFPLAYVKVLRSGRGLQWQVLDDPFAIDYEVPRLRFLRLQIDTKGKGWLRRFDERIKRIRIEAMGDRAVLDGAEESTIAQLGESIRSFDPDIIATPDGDSFTIPYLYHRASMNGVADTLPLHRDGSKFSALSPSGRSYLSYGNMGYWLPAQRMRGRIHIDESNSSVQASCGLHGLFEVARMCRVPLYTALRASIGRCMSSAQFYEAWKQGLLIPWKPTFAERFKDAWSMFEGDRGGRIFEPMPGVYEHVGEVDFTSLYPNIMIKKNISCETVSCECCPDSPLMVPELGYHICHRRRGIVPRSLEPLVRKRMSYKALSKADVPSEFKQAYQERSEALKWVLVCCFGYLSFRNAKFGRIDAHMAVCAFARDTLRIAARIAEGRGFQLIYGLVDSLWLGKAWSSEEEYRELCGEIETETGFPMGFEGIYRWLVLLPSKPYRSLPALNRYFGVLQDGHIKVRGIGARRSDCPPLIAKFQQELLQLLAQASDLEGIREMAPSISKMVQSYLDRLTDGRVCTEDLLITKTVSKHGSEYSHEIHQAVALRQLEQMGAIIHPGQNVSYLILDADDPLPSRRVRAWELVEDGSRYDVRKYSDMLREAAIEILNPLRVPIHQTR